MVRELKETLEGKVGESRRKTDANPQVDEHVRSCRDAKKQAGVEGR